MIEKSFAIPNFFGPNMRAAIYAFGRKPGNWAATTRKFAESLRDQTNLLESVNYGSTGHFDFHANSPDIFDQLSEDAKGYGLAVASSANGFEAISPKLSKLADGADFYTFWSAKRDPVTSLGGQTVIRLEWRIDARTRTDWARKHGWKVGIDRIDDDLVICFSKT